MVIVLFSIFSISVGLYIGIRFFLSVFCLKWFDGWRNGRSNTTEERGVLWFIVCECCGVGVMGDWVFESVEGYVGGIVSLRYI